jgi:hypothetical protein
VSSTLTGRATSNPLSLPIYFRVFVYGLSVLDTRVHRVDRIKYEVDVGAQFAAKSVRRGSSSGAWASKSALRLPVNSPHLNPR